jgi:ethanolamine kinase
MRLADTLCFCVRYWCSFEYACYNHRGWDLGNHFCEHTGFDLDWTKFPSREKQMFFLTRYATHTHTRRKIQNTIAQGMQRDGTTRALHDTTRPQC